MSLRVVNIWNRHYFSFLLKITICNIALITLINPIQFVIKDSFAKFGFFLLMDIYSVYRDHMSMICKCIFFLPLFKVHCIFYWNLSVRKSYKWSGMLRMFSVNILQISYLCLLYVWWCSIVFFLLDFDIVQNTYKLLNRWFSKLSVYF